MIYNIGDEVDIVGSDNQVGFVEGYTTFSDGEVVYLVYTGYDEKDWQALWPYSDNPYRIYTEDQLAIYPERKAGLFTKEGWGLW